MHVVTSWPQVRNQQQLIAVIGNFDGVHRGHHSLIETARKSKTDSIELAVITFSPHPIHILAPDRVQPMLTTVIERRQCFEHLGVDLCVELPFNHDIAILSPVEFIKKMTRHFAFKKMVVGYNFRFGAKATGDIKGLQHLGSVFDFEVEIIDPVLDEFGCAISSTKIRHHLLQGELSRANGMLGRPYELTGEVIRGDGRGASMGFATANMQVPENKLLPRDGVYIAKVKGHRIEAKGMVYIGFKPTFDAQNRTVETHLFSHADDKPLYGQQLTVDFLHYLRPEKKFSTVKALQQQIHKDIECARKLL